MFCSMLNVEFHVYCSILSVYSIDFTSKPHLFFFLFLSLHFNRMSNEQIQKKMSSLASKSTNKFVATPKRSASTTTDPPSPDAMPPPKEVTPLDPSATSSSASPSSTSAKAVRFEGKAVSRRGGRFGSPDRRCVSYKSPQRSAADVPSLCSSKEHSPPDDPPSKPSSISVSAPSEQTSPLATHSPKKQPPTERRNVTFSPPPPPPRDDTDKVRTTLAIILLPF